VNDFTVRNGGFTAQALQEIEGMSDWKDGRRDVY